MDHTTVSEEPSFTNQGEFYLKVLLKKEARIMDCLQLSEALKTNPLVKEIFIELELHPLDRLHTIQLRLQKKYCETKKLLTFFEKKESGTKK